VATPQERAREWARTDHNLNNRAERGWLAGYAAAVEDAAQVAEDSANSATIAQETLGATWAEYITRRIRALLPS